MLHSDSCAFARSAFLKDEPGRADFSTSRISRQGYAQAVGAICLIEALIVRVLAWSSVGKAARFTLNTGEETHAMLSG